MVDTRFLDETSSFERVPLFEEHRLSGTCFFAEVARGASQTLAEDHGHAPGIGEARTFGDATDIQIGLTILTIMGIDIPQEMTGNSLV